MKILVTGGAGFIGSAVIRHIIGNTPDDVINLDKLTYAGNLESLKCVATNSRYHFEQMDICDRSALDNLFSKYKPDIVFTGTSAALDRKSDFFPDLSLVKSSLALKQAFNISLSLERSIQWHSKKHTEPERLRGV